MARFFHPLLLLFAKATSRELHRYLEFLKEENKLLRSKLPKRIEVTPKERRRLVRLGKNIRPSLLKQLLTIVSPRTFARWINGEEKAPKPAQTGRPRTPEALRELILKIATETGWGYTRILGELRKLGYRKISRQTVKNILKAAGLDPGPKRGEGTWDEFLKAHAETLWACDFISKRVWTPKGLVDAFVLVWIHIASRRVIVSPSTVSPDNAWVAQQARNFCLQLPEQKLNATYVLRDGDKKYPKGFDEVLKTEGIKPHRITFRSPNLNAYCERMVQTLKVECLNAFVVLGLKHLDHIVREFVAYYHTARPHQGVGNRLLIGDRPPDAESVGPPGPNDVVCHERLGGLLKHFERKTAA